MEHLSKEENTQVFSQKEESQEQIKFSFPEEKEETDILEHQILSDILTSHSVGEHQNISDNTLEMPGHEENLEQLSFEEFLKSPENIDIEPLKEIYTEDIADIEMQTEPEQQSHAELAQEIEISVQEVQMDFQDEILPLDNHIAEEHLNILPPTMPIPITREQDGNFSVKKGTKKAFYVLKDIFGDIETEADKLAAQEYEVSPRKKLGALLLALSLGFFGAHRLYLGQYKRVPEYLLTIFFWRISRDFLPDLGLANMLSIVMVFWVIADILAIIFSRRIRDGKNRVVERWL